MDTYHFIPENFHLLNWFEDSPDAGDPACICSLSTCGKVIADGEMPLRIFREQNGTEVRLHIQCAEQVIVEFAPKPEVIYKEHPAFALGKAAQKDGERRGANPHRTAGASRNAWWAGWDSAWQEDHPQVRTF